MRNPFSLIVTNKALFSAVVAWFFAQFLKLISTFLRKGKLDFRWFLSTGGIFSAHTAVVSALTISIGMNYGWSSGLFAISAILAGVVISDAQGIRKAAGKQAEVLNKIIEDVYQKKELKIERLKELLGHTPQEIFFGIILGALIAILVSLL
jgi:acid phosphatase family membrane protein YuiD